MAGVSVLIMVGVLAGANRYADGDMGHLIAVEMRVAQLLRAGDLGLAAHLWWALITPQPPLGYSPGIVAYTIFGFQPWVAPMVMGLSLLLIWDGLWRVWERRAWMGWIGVCASPMVWLAVEQHSRDLLAAAALVQAWSWLAASRGFRLRIPACAFGVWLGIGFMTKYTFPIFAAPICLGTGVGLLVHASRERWKHLGFSVLGFLLPAGVWYTMRGSAVLEYVGFSSGAEMAANTANYRDSSTLESLLYYPLALRDALSLPGAALVAVASFLGLRSREFQSPVALALAGVAGGIGILSTLPEAIDRYALPASVLLLAILPALGNRLAAALPIALCFMPMTAYTLGRFKAGAPEVTAAYDHPLQSASALAWPYPPTYRPSDLDPAAWKLGEVVAAIHAAKGESTGTIGILSGRGPTAGPTFATVLIEAAGAGLAYDYATVNTQNHPRAHPIFVGPLFDGEWPSAEFTVLVAFRTAQGDPNVDAWLRAHPMTEVTRVLGANGGSSTVYRHSGNMQPGASTPRGPGGSLPAEHAE